MHANLPQSARRGFSLMELMVVITIIAILSSIIIPAGHAVQGNVKKVQAQKTCTELRTALMSYFSEYKRFPPFTSTNAGTDATFATDSSSPMMPTLLGVDAVNNRRSVQFFSTRPAKGQGLPGLYRGQNGAIELLDPFLSAAGGSTSNPYYIMVDSNYDNSLQVPARGANGGTEEIFSNVAVWSYGLDGVQGSQGKTSDDITAY